MLADTDLKPLVEGEPKLLQVDSIGAWLWASAEKRLIRIDAQATSSALSIALPKQPTAIALDDIRGVVWALSEHQLDAISSSGLPIASIDFKALAIKDSTALAFDPVTRTVLVGHRAGLTRFSGDGSRLGTVVNARRVEAIGVSPLVLETTLNLVSPVPGTLTSNPSPPIALQLKTLCSGSDCGFSDEFYEGYTLSVLLGGQQVGPLFAIDRNTGFATYQPASRLPEGEVWLSATATDGFGYTSPLLSASFTIDTIAPIFLSLTPASPFLTNQPNIAIAGRLNEPASLVVGSTAVPVSADGSFAAERSLTEGLNAFTLQATDLAGNAATASIAVTLDTIAPRIVSISPPDGAIVGAAALTISGDVDESADIALAWIGAPQTASGTAFAFAVTLAPGANVLRVRATDRAGNVGQHTINVGYVPVAVLVDAPADGSTVASASVAVTGTFTGPPGTRVVVNGSDATISGGTFSAIVELAFGSNAITVVAASPEGLSATTTLVVTRESTGSAPTITFHEPAEGATFVAPASIPIVVGATNADGSQAWVEVRNDSPLGFSVGVGESGLAEYYWNDVPEGTYEIIATVFQPDGSGSHEVACGHGAPRSH
ncbi:MAG: hypothetical protein IPH30_03490 [Betaproteobacteria bacterium]|nr:hypothetical protein [Betaproteobacteria bacterium]